MTRTWPFVLLIACSGDTKDPTPIVEDDTADGLDTDAEDTDLEPLEGAQLTGRVYDVSGGLITGGLRLQFCRQTVCLSPQRFRDGEFTFEGLDAGPGSFESVSISEGTRYANAFVPLTVGEDEIKSVDITVPLLGTAITLPAVAAPLEVAPGFWLTLGEGQLDRPSPFDDIPTEVAGVDATAHRLPVEGVVGEVLAMWYLWPFDSRLVETTSQIPVSIVDMWTLASGEAELWMGDYYTASWVRVDDLDKDGDRLVTHTGAGLPHLSTVIVVRKP